MFQLGGSKANEIIPEPRFSEDQMEVSGHRAQVIQLSNDGFFHEINHPAMGVPQSMETPRWILSVLSIVSSRHLTTPE